MVLRLVAPAYNGPGRDGWMQLRQGDTVELADEHGQELLDSFRGWFERVGGAEAPPPRAEAEGAHRPEAAKPKRKRPWAPGHLRGTNDGAA